MLRAALAATTRLLSRPAASPSASLLAIAASPATASPSSPSRAAVSPLSVLAARSFHVSTAAAKASDAGEPTTTAAADAAVTTTTTKPTLSRRAALRELRSKKLAHLKELRTRAFEQNNPEVPLYLNLLKPEDATVASQNPAEALRLLRKSQKARAKLVRRGKPLLRPAQFTPTELLQMLPQETKQLLVNSVTRQREAWVRRVFPATAEESATLMDGEGKIHVPRNVVMREIPTQRTLMSLSDYVFGAAPRTDLIHRYVLWHLACQRAGTASTKTKAEVRGGGRKPRPQKHTGRARLGSIRSPMMRGGGVAFGPKPKSFAYVLPKTVRRFALRAALSIKYAQGDLQIVDSLSPIVHKAKYVGHILRSNNLTNALLVDEKASPNLIRGASTMQTVKAVSVDALSVYDIMKYSKLVLTTKAVAALEDFLHLHLVTRPRTRALIRDSYVAAERLQTSQPTQSVLSASEREGSAVVPVPGPLFVASSPAASSTPATPAPIVPHKRVNSPRRKREHKRKLAKRQRQVAYQRTQRLERERRERNLGIQR
ncbi:ribosomal protein L4/L1e [Capsaspora owczarzaki ATCC 30864]|uniref:Large ribosomal subunit protein uL4m n=1 Tax=Capsaspora owczarzaki (strain ATCC 30864) TaxID=595528 RepID=A0A0D2X593_CAPO3|nr:ribosomal protein L4/L1e [Capsaspora owczarzaki ATCC 30864]KJE97409.1 ribosomal protein L4/L1e [Capsaspora owczarzaki ATCC 30864]|eukprot:XP_004343136.1 ribosomal protein L4/L1e [Capsaspora owczarzaki ATCC 30864]